MPTIASRRCCEHSFEKPGLEAQGKHLSAFKTASEPTHSDGGMVANLTGDKQDVVAVVHLRHGSRL